MMQISSITCIQTGLQCQRTACLQGLRCILGNPAETVTQQVGANDYRLPSPNVGWKCPVCGKGNAPFMPICGNTMCGVKLEPI
jgi:hypothetical protein